MSAEALSPTIRAALWMSGALASFMAMAVAGRELSAQLTYMTAIQLPIALATALPGWVWPSVALWPWVGVVAVTALSAHYCMTRAFRLADATVVVPMDFPRLPLIAVAGFMFYGEALNLWVLVGAAMVFAGTWFNLKGTGA